MSGGHIEGTVTGPGRLEKKLNEPLTIASGATLSTGEVMIFHGLLNVASGATYDTATETGVRGGNLELAGPAETGSLSISSGDLNGTGSASLAVSGKVEWDGGSIGNGNGSTSKLKLVQTGGDPFSIFGSSEARLLRGAGVSIETTSPVSITNHRFRLAEGVTLATTSTITLGPVEFEGGGIGTLTAAGLITSGNTVAPTFDFHLTGSESSLKGGAVRSRK